MCLKDQFLATVSFQQYLTIRELRLLCSCWGNNDRTQLKRKPKQRATERDRAQTRHQLTDHNCLKIKVQYLAVKSVRFGECKRYFPEQPRLVRSAPDDFNQDIRKLNKLPEVGMTWRITGERLKGSSSINNAVTKCSTESIFLKISKLKNSWQ